MSWSFGVSEAVRYTSVMLRMRSPRVLKRISRTAIAIAIFVVAPSLLAQEPEPETEPPADIPSPDADAPPPQAPVKEPDVVAAALTPKPGGLTPKSVQARAVKAHPSVKQRAAEIDAADAVADQVFVGYFPIVKVSASYTRLSNVDNVTVTGPCPLAPNLVCTLTEEEFDSLGIEVGGNSVIGLRNFVPLFLNRYAIVHSIIVPVSDYFVAVPAAHESAILTAEARRIDKRMQEAVVATNARVALYGWVAAIGQIEVAKLAIAQGKAHVKQAEQLKPTGLATSADVLAFEAQLAASEQLLVEAEGAASITREQLRLLVDAPATEQLSIGFDVFAQSAAKPSRPLATYYRRALSRRLELQSMAKTKDALRQIERRERANYAPKVNLFANAYLQNPNPRNIPTRARWGTTWDAGVSLTWTVNDAFTTIGRVAEAEANTRAVTAQRASLERAIKIEVATEYAAVTTATATVKTSKRRLAVAEERLRAEQELFAVGEGDSVAIIDAQTGLTQARFERLQALIDLLVARARFDHVTGADLR